MTSLPGTVSDTINHVASAFQPPDSQIHANPSPEPLHVFFLQRLYRCWSTSTKRDSAEGHGFHLVNMSETANVLSPLRTCVHWPLLSCNALMRILSTSLAVVALNPSAFATFFKDNVLFSDDPQLASTTALAISLNFKTDEFDPRPSIKIDWPSYPVVPSDNNESRSAHLRLPDVTPTAQLAPSSYLS
jgi:hypothetical protein